MKLQNFCMVLLPVLLATSGEAQQPTKMVNELVTQIVKLASGRGDVDDVADDLVKRPAAQSLGSLLTSLSTAELQAIVVQDRPKQELAALRIGLECMPPDKYISLVKLLLATHPFPKERTTELLYPFVNYNHLFEDNWQRNEVREIVEIALRVLDGDKDMAAHLNDIRTGAAKKKIDEYRLESGDQVKPVVLLSQSGTEKTVPTDATLHVPIAKPEHIESKPTASSPNEQITSPAPWSAVVVLIVAAIGLLWLLIKGRK